MFQGTSPFVKPFVSSFVNPFVSPFGFKGQTTQQAVKPLDMNAMPQAQLPRVLQWAGDYSGCGLWRLVWPEHVLNAHQKLVVHTSTSMSYDPRHFAGVKTVRVQRQATPHQLHFIKFLRELSNQQGFKIIYEVDDVIFAEDIPDYNKFKPAFVNPEIRKSSEEIMSLCDEITVTCDFMKDYYKSKISNQNITVIPNFPPRFWCGNFYNPGQIDQNYRNFCCDRRNKPRILYPGSGAHFDVDNRTNQNDDFAHVRDVIAKTADQFQWVFMGAYPPPLHDLVKTGKIEFHPWKRLYEYPQMIYDLKINLTVAPLQNNTFNKAKSDLKYIESGCFGIPAVCQDLVTYKDAPYKFTTGDEMIDQIKTLIKSTSFYKHASSTARKVAETRFLEKDENIDMYVELFNHPYRSPERKLLNNINK